jgi:hypothetical protein
VRNAVKTNVLLTLAIIGAGLVLAGCKSAPPLAQDQALAMIQAKYDATPAAGANITLTPDGKKLVKLTGGGDLIKWRPDSPTDKKYSIVLVTVTANHLKARDIKDVQDVGKTKTVLYTEGVDLTGVPAPLVSIAHNPGNQLSVTRQADFVLDGDAWKLQSIE